MFRIYLSGLSIIYFYIYILFLTVIKVPNFDTYYKKDFIFLFSK